MTTPRHDGSVSVEHALPFSRTVGGLAVPCYCGSARELLEDGTTLCQTCDDLASPAPVRDISADWIEAFLRTDPEMLGTIIHVPTWNRRGYLACAWPWPDDSRHPRHRWLRR